MTLPWETAAASAPWLSAQPLYSRLIAITRPKSELSTSGGAGNAPVSQTGGSTPYFGDRNTQGGETAVVGTIVNGVAATGVSASIQAVGSRVVGPIDALPSSAAGPIRWLVFIPASAGLANGTILDRDVVTDDVGARYKVSAANWDVPGWKLETIRLEA